jgi:hypothetical protein
MSESRYRSRSGRSFFLALVCVGLVGRAGRAQGLRPADAPFVLDSARSASARGDDATADALFRKLEQLDPRNGAYWLGQADADRRLGRNREAIGSLERAIDLGFGSRPVRSYQVSRLFAQLGQRDSALVWLQRSLNAGYEFRPEIGQDSAFITLFGDSTFKRLAGREALPSERNAGWRADLAILVDEARRLSGGPLKTAWTHAFDSAADYLDRHIPDLSDEGVYAGMQSMVTLLGSGHSILFPLPAPRLSLKMLPIDLYQFSDGYYVVSGTGLGSSLVGMRADSIDGVAIEDVIRRIAPLIDRDNPIGLAWNGPYFATYPALLAAVGIGSSRDSVTLSLTRSESAGARRITLGAGELRPPGKLQPTGRGEAPLYLRNPSRNFWFEPLDGGHTLYVEYNQVANDSLESVAEFADSLLASARRATTRDMIIDVRRNNGGSGDLNRPLVRALIQFEGLGGRRQVYVITGRNTFSAAQNFINDTEQWTHALFAGEPSSSRPHFIGEDTEILLPNSGIMGSIGSRYFQDTGPLDERLWIATDIPVRLASADYFGNRDPVLSAVLEHIRRSEARK